MILGSGRAGAGRSLGRAALVIVPVALLLGAGTWLFTRATRIDPPRLDVRVLEAATRPLQMRGTRAFVGDSWIGHDRGVWELHLEGDAVALGWAAGRLANRLFLDGEDALLTALLPVWPHGAWGRAQVRWRYRHLADELPKERAEELAAFARAVDDLHADLLRTYQRLVLENAFVEVAEREARGPWNMSAAFAAGGPATANGHLLVARSLDVDGPELLDRDKLVSFVRAPGKLAFAAVGWAGLAGVVTGVNATGLFVSVAPARSDDGPAEGLWAPLLARAVLEEAHTVDEAVARLRHLPPAGAALYLVADGKSGDAAVVERSPRRLEVRRARRDEGTVAASNHALGAAFAGDAENDRVRRYLPSGARQHRLEELLKHAHGQLDAKKALEILRDKRGAGDAPLGLGNRTAIDALSAVHGVVVDLTGMMLWVSEGPHLSGRLVAYDLRHELAGQDDRPAPELPGDAITETAEYRDWLLARAELRAAERLRTIDPRAALDSARRAAALEDALPEPHRLLGDLLRAAGDRDGARREYERFLALHPPFLSDAEEVKGLLDTL
jgi:hypothetical protein